MKIHSVTIASLVLGPIATFGACGSSGDSGASIAIDDLGRQVIAAECEFFVRCGQASDMATCETLIMPVLGRGFDSFNAAVIAVKAGRITYDGAAARTCVEELRDLSCSARSAMLDDSSCGDLFTGTVANGGPCASDEECLPSSFCVAPPDNATGAAACAGTCTPGGTVCQDNGDCAGGRVCDTRIPTSGGNGSCVTPVAAGGAGQPCGTNGACQSGLVCDGSMCAPLPTAGQACLSFACADGLICVSDSGPSLVCMVPAQKGQSCQARGQCGGPFSSLTCDEVSHLCVEAPTTGPCTTARDCNMLSSYCDTSEAMPTCKPYASVGSACNLLGGRECGHLFSENSCEPTGTPSSTGICAAPVSCSL